MRSWDKMAASSPNHRICCIDPAFLMKGHLPSWLWGCNPTPVRASRMGYSMSLFFLPSWWPQFAGPWLIERDTDLDFFSISTVFFFKMLSPNVECVISLLMYHTTYMFQNWSKMVAWVLNALEYFAFVIMILLHCFYDRVVIAHWCSNVKPK